MEYKKIKPQTFWERMLLKNLKELTKEYEKASCLTIGDFPELDDDEEWEEEEEEEDCIRKGRF